MKNSIKFGKVLFCSVLGCAWFAVAAAPASAQTGGTTVEGLHEKLATTDTRQCEELPSYVRYPTGGGEQRCNFRVETCSYSCHYVRTWSCFPAETKILMGDQSLKRADEIATGDMVWNPILQQPVAVGNLLQGPEAKPLWEIGYGTTKVTVTETHPIPVQGNERAGGYTVQPAGLRESQDASAMAHVKVLRAQDITTKHSVLGADGKFYRVTTARKLPVNPGQVVYNFELNSGSLAPQDHMIVADGIVVGDVRVQGQLNHKTLPWEERK